MKRETKLVALRRDLLILKGSWGKVAREAGVGYDAVFKLANGTSEPYDLTIDLVAAAVRREKNRRSSRRSRERETA